MPELQAVPRHQTPAADRASRVDPATIHFKISGATPVYNVVAQECKRDSPQLNPQCGAGRDPLAAVRRLVGATDTPYQS